MESRAYIFDIKRDCSEDGPGIRTTVFFKGCPLSCSWCQNPEGKTDDTRLSFREEACKPEQCGVACVSVCEAHCLSYVDKLRVAHDQCTRCDKCFAVCPTRALEPVGYWIELEDLLYRVSVDRPFYDSTGGGVTLSGGEATDQMDFCAQFLQALKKQNIHTALETSGFFNYRRFVQLMLPHLDLIYFDLKLIDDSESRKYTGQSNRLILRNFERLVTEAEIPVIPRIPLIPGITDSQDNLSGIAHYLRDQGVISATLIPYNPLWTDKMQRLGLKTSYQHRSYMTSEEQAASVHNFYSGK